MWQGQAAAQSAAQHSSRALPAAAVPVHAAPPARPLPHRIPQHRDRQQQYMLPPCHAARRQQQQQRDRPDMGPRSSRRVKIPSPAEYLGFADSRTTESADPGSQGFQERALLMAYLESLDPAMRQQFEQYMEMQMQQMQQQQEVGDAAAYMQGVLDKAVDRADLSADTFDAAEYVDSPDAQHVMWQSLREQFSPKERSLLDSIFGHDWQSFDAKGFTPEAMQGVKDLSPGQQAMLMDIMSRMSDMTQSMDKLANPAADDSKPSSSSSSSSRPSGSSSSSSSSSWGSSFHKRKSARVRSRATEAAEQHWDKFLDGKMTDKVQKMLFYADQMSKGQLMWGRPPSTHFNTLKQIYTEMVQLEGSQQFAPGKLSQADVQSAFTRINYTLNQLVSQVDAAGGDTATRSALLYMDALFNNSSSSSSSSSVVAAASSSSSSSSSRITAASTSSSSSSIDGSSNQQQQQQGGVDLDKLQKLGRFLKAAENLDAFQTWLGVFSEKHPDLATTDMLLLSNLGGDDWFLRPQQQQEALTAAEAAAAAWQQQSSSSSSSIRSAISGALLPYIDEDRIEALAVLDAETLWFLAELEANNYDEDVLLKWSLHPEISQKITQGNWFDESEMSDMIKKLYQQAKVPDFMAGLNFEVKQK